MSACARCGAPARNRFAVLCLKHTADVDAEFEQRRGRACSPFQGQVGPMLGTLEERGLVTFYGLTVTMNR